MLEVIGVILLKSYKTNYQDIVISFDIETTNLSELQLTGVSSIKPIYIKHPYMYIWMLNIDGELKSGRTWLDFAKEYRNIIDTYHVTINNRVVIWVHNLSFEFAFIQGLFDWVEDEFTALKSRDIIKAVTVDGVEFRCSLKLSGVKLEKLGQQVGVAKLVGDLDYDLVRTPDTPLTDKEMEYCWHDVIIVGNYIKNKIAEHGGIAKIPLTKTGYVRRYCKNYCLALGDEFSSLDKFKGKDYYNNIHGLNLTVEEYLLAKTAFQGGFTHANVTHNGEILKEVHSYDFTSAYPAVALSETFPMSCGRKVEIKTLDELKYILDKYHCLIEAKIFNLVSKTDQDNYLSGSRIIEIENPVLDNGRVIAATLYHSVFTEIDFKDILKYYDADWELTQFPNIYIYEKSYLPKRLLNCILYFYKKKTELKGVEGKEEEYTYYKELLNSIYGMMVTDIVRANHYYSNDKQEWEKQLPDYEEAIDKYNNDKNRFISYLWGVWITSYNRHNLWTAINELQDDYVYSDTDSVKFLNLDKHQDYFNNYNKTIVEKLKKCCETRQLEWGDFNPKTIKGKTKTIGIWDYEGAYTYFKTLGAKRYLTYKNSQLSLTVSGLNKNKTIPYLLDSLNIKYERLVVEDSEYFKVESNIDVLKVFNTFNLELYIPKGETGKLIHTFITESQVATIEDYQGNKSEVELIGGVYLEPADYSFSTSNDYSLLLDIVDGVYTWEQYQGFKNPILEESVTEEDIQFDKDTTV